MFITFVKAQKTSNVDFRNSCAKLLTIKTRVAIFIVLLFNNKNVRYLCLVLFSETYAIERALIQNLSSTRVSTETAPHQTNVSFPYRKKKNNEI